jgi:hypothetical protein
MVASTPSIHLPAPVYMPTSTSTSMAAPAPMHVSTGVH